MSGKSLAPDPNFARELRQARISTEQWETDFSRHSVPFSEIFSGGVPRDGIPPIDNPDFVAVKMANSWLEAHEPVVSLEVNNEAKAYPLQILTRHEIVNDEVGGMPVTVTFCPLCNSAIVFDRRLGDVVYDFGVSGMLRNSDLIMWDRQTQSWWQQLTGEAIVGELTGCLLTSLPAAIVSWKDFSAANPAGLVLSQNTGFARQYGENPYPDYDRPENPPFLFRGDLDARLPPKERIAAVTVNDVNVAFPFTTLEQERVVNYTVSGQDLVVFFKSGTRSALDDRLISRSRDVGATGVFDPVLNGRKLTFRLDDQNFMDNETNSVWSIFGQATKGPSAGDALTPITHANPFWFSWQAFKPNTLIYPAAA